jgi:hypothetical protein
MNDDKRYDNSHARKEPSFVPYGPVRLPKTLTDLTEMGRLQLVREAEKDAELVALRARLAEAEAERNAAMARRNLLQAHLNESVQAMAAYQRRNPERGLDCDDALLPILKAALTSPAPAPIPLILSCPKCGLLHIDAPDPAKDWTNPPHKSHLCHGCGTIWRPADVPTVGVAAITTKGRADTWSPSCPISR